MDPIYGKIAQAPGLSLQVRLDMLDIVKERRLTSRLLLKREDAIKVATLLLSYKGLEVLVDKHLVTQLVAKPGMPFIDDLCFQEKISDSQTEELICMYISNNKANAEKAMQADHSASDSDLGAALGYPACCVGSVVARGKVPTIHESALLYSKEFRFDPLIWPPAALFDAALLPHYPCNRDCPQSRLQAEKRWGDVCMLFPKKDLERVKKASQANYYLTDLGELSNTISNSSKILSPDYKLSVIETQT
jgi:hypothetical protein